MPMGIVSDEDFLNEVKSLNKVPCKVEIITTELGRGKGSTEVPNEVRKIIGEVGIVDRQGALTIASSLGISSSSASAYARGDTSLSECESADQVALIEHIKKSKNKIRSAAHSKLEEALESITPIKMAEAKVRDVAAIASSMSAIIKNMEPEGEKGDRINSPSFVIYAPSLKSEEHFDTIYAKE